MYNQKDIEKKWQKVWDQTQAFKTTWNKSKKFYSLDMFPYPSGAGLHVGHPVSYTAADIVARFKRLNGFDVMHPMGWDAFGLPAEQYAIQTGNHPAEFTQKNIQNFKKQLKMLAFSYDFDLEVDTTDPKFYKQTQWIFLQMYKKGLAELRDVEVNWCEGLGTVLANEEIVIDEKGNSVSERGNFPVIKKPMKQWVLKITAYADKLVEGLAGLDWPSSLVALQKNWIFNEDGSLHLRDWIFSRQRYWGEPFPFAFDEQGTIKVIEELPVILPETSNIKPSGTGESPLANITDWLYFVEDGKKYRRETNTMPQWAGSSWYYLAYILKNADGSYLDLDSKEAYERFQKWLPVDLYIGGQEHAVLHFLYARFWHKVLFDLGYVPTPEPFFKVVNQGMILGPDGQKMSKSKGNVINPDDIVNELGADTLRTYVMFMGPLEDTKAWSTDAIKGVRRWLDRIERLFEISLNNISNGQKMNATDETKLASLINKLVKELTAEIDTLKFNTAISKMMVFINELYKMEVLADKKALGTFAVMLSLFAPHLAEELLERIGEKQIMNQQWPTFDESKIISEEITIAVQVNGKLRGTIAIQGTEQEQVLFETAKQLENVHKVVVGKQIIKQIYVKNKIINFVVK